MNKLILIFSILILNSSCLNNKINRKRSKSKKQGLLQSKGHSNFDNKLDDRSSSSNSNPSVSKVTENICSIGSRDIHCIHTYNTAQINIITSSEIQKAIDSLSLLGRQEGKIQNLLLPNQQSLQYLIQDTIFVRPWVHIQGVGSPTIKFANIGHIHYNGDSSSNWSKVVYDYVLSNLTSTHIANEFLFKDIYLSYEEGLLYLVGLRINNSKQTGHQDLSKALIILNKEIEQKFSHLLHLKRPWKGERFKGKAETLYNPTFTIDLLNFTNTCILEDGKRIMCLPSSIPPNTKKVIPSFSYILSKRNYFPPLPLEIDRPIFFAGPDYEGKDFKDKHNIGIKGLKIICKGSSPYYPVKYLINGKPSGTGSGYLHSAISLNNLHHAKIEDNEIKNCTMGVYTLNSKFIAIKGNKFDMGISDNQFNGDGLAALSAHGMARGHAPNAIRIHGTEDSNILIEDNIIGTDGPIKRGPIRGIHIHGTSPSKRKRAPFSPNESSSLNELIVKIGMYSDPLDLQGNPIVGRNSIVIRNNTILKSYESGIDIRGDQENILITGNQISNVLDKMSYKGEGIHPRGAGILISAEKSTIGTFNFFSSGEEKSKIIPEFYFFPRNIKLENNLIRNSHTGILIFGPPDQSAAYIGFNQRPETKKCIESQGADLPDCSMNILVQKNTIINPEHTGISILYGKDLTIDSNRIHVKTLRKNLIFRSGKIPLVFKNNVLFELNSNYEIPLLPNR